jgi:hypothetical protein
MRELVRDHRLLVEPSSLTTWIKEFVNCSEEDVKFELYHIQHKLGQLIRVCSLKGLFYYSPIKPSQWQIEELCHLQGDHRDFMMFDGLRPSSLGLVESDDVAY